MSTPRGFASNAPAVGNTIGGSAAHAPRHLDWSTLPPATGAETGHVVEGLETLGLAVLWSRDAPERVGEVLLVPPGDRGTWTFGRGEASGEARRLSLARQVPGGVVGAGPLASPRISRTQLRLSVSTPGALLVENVGSCPLVRAGRACERAEIAPGEVISLRNELSFLCVRRTPIPAGDDPAGALQALGAPDAFGIVGETPAIWELRHRIAAVARHAFHVLILGASGSGKELVAQAIHALSPRGKRPMVTRNAATIPEGLADAELFGNLRGYPNPGMTERPGLVGEANGSTLFLDEFAELPPTLQAHLLRVLDAGEYQRLGEATTRRTDLRVLAATNRPTSDVKHDVLARFKVRIEVPDLNARREDIPLLVAYLLRTHASKPDGFARRFFPEGDLMKAPLVSPVLMEALVLHGYETHVRELDALLVRATLEGRGRYLELGPALKSELEKAAAGRAPRVTAAPELADLTPEESRRLALLRKHRFSPTACGRDADYKGNRQTADLHLRQLLCRALQITGGDAASAAEKLAGPGDAELREKCAARLATFLGNLRTRIANEPPDALDKALAEEWKSGAESVQFVVAALREGRVSGA
jgi:two-component system nitrogen regulation response regulator GlnG/two-component system response regulator HydG